MNIPEKKNFRYFGITAENLLGYLYSGIIVLIVIEHFGRGFFNELKENLGLTVLLISAVTFGIIFYTFYYRIIGEFILFPIQYKVHNLLDILTNKKGDNLTSTTKYLRFLGVKRWKGQEAYQEIRFNLYPKNKQYSTMLQHGELNLLYITFLIACCAVLLSIITRKTDSITLQIIITIILYLIALVGDTRQQIKETLLIKSLDKKLVTEYLNNQGLLEKPINSEFQHYGYISKDKEAFEKFWCSLCGYEFDKSVTLTSAEKKALFSRDGDGDIFRYKKASSPDLEVLFFA
jgi:hypothetical protein